MIKIEFQPGLMVLDDCVKQPVSAGTNNIHYTRHWRIGNCNAGLGAMIYNVRNKLIWIASMPYRNQNSLTQAGPEWGGQTTGMNLQDVMDLADKCIEDNLELIKSEVS